MRIPRFRTLTGLTRIPAIIAGGLAITRRGGWKAAAARLGAVALLAGGLTAATGSAAQARALHCGDVITANTKLTSDLVNCPDTGIVIGADNITLDLNGHIIDGDGIPPASCPPATLCDVGVDNSTGHSHVTITGGTIRQFDLGVGVAGGSGAAAADHIHHLAIAHTTSVAIVAIDTTRTVIDHNAIRDPGTSAVVVLGSAQARVASNMGTGATGYAMFLPDDSNSRIVHNRLTASKHGFAIGGSHNLVRSNVVTNSGGSIDIFDGATATRVEFNRLSRVGDGIPVAAASSTLIAHNVVDSTGRNDTIGVGIALDGSVDSTVKRNIIHTNSPRPAPGIFVGQGEAPTPPRNNRVIRNVTTSKNFDGIFVDPNAVATLLLRNLAVHSGHDGIGVLAPGTTLTRNTANHNHDLGISAVAGVIDGGGNQAAGNGNPAQCTNISCR
jgi:large repetitive protein